MQTMTRPLKRRCLLAAPTPPPPPERDVDSVRAQLDSIASLLGSAGPRAATDVALLLAASPAGHLQAPLAQPLHDLHDPIGNATASLESTLEAMVTGHPQDDLGLLRHELVHRCLLASFYESRALAGAGYAAAGTCSAAEVMHSDVKAKAIANYERAMAVASLVNEHAILTYCALGVAELHMSRRDLDAAAATFARCRDEYARVEDPVLRSSLLQRVLPLSMEVLNMQGRAAESFACWRAYTAVLAAAGRSIPDECPICADEFTPCQACVALSCGHSFHRHCCDTWLGHRMFATGEFRAECPLCKQVDASLKATPAALQALAAFKRARSIASSGRASSSGSGSGSGSGNRSGSESDEPEPAQLNRRLGSAESTEGTAPES